MAVNVFEELVRTALNAQGYLTFENAAYRRHANARSLIGNGSGDNAASDIDIIAFSPRKCGQHRVLAVNCKSGKDGLMLPRDADRITEGSSLPVGGAAARTGFRELYDADWAKAYRSCVERWTGERIFTHVTAVRHFQGDKASWTSHSHFMATLTPYLELWDLDDVVRRLLKGADRLHINNNILKLVDLFHRAA